MAAWGAAFVISTDGQGATDDAAMLCSGRTANAKTIKKSRIRRYIVVYFITSGLPVKAKRLHPGPAPWATCAKQTSVGLRHDLASAVHQVMRRMTNKFVIAHQS